MQKVKTKTKKNKNETKMQQQKNNNNKSNRQTRKIEQIVIIEDQEDVITTVTPRRFCHVLCNARDAIESHTRRNRVCY